MPTYIWLNPKYGGIKMATGKSPAFSFKGWDIWKFIKGRKKTAVTIVATVLGYFITNNETVAIVAGGIVESVFALTDYYIKKK